MFREFPAKMFCSAWFLPLPNSMKHYLHLGLSVCEHNVLIKTTQPKLLETVVNLQFSIISDRSQMLLALPRFRPECSASIGG